jgi:hypothetical protein
MKHFIFCLIIIFLPASIFPADGMTGVTKYSYSIDWESEFIDIEISSPIPQTGKDLPSAGFRVEKAIDSQVYDILKEALFSLQVNSRQKGIDFFRNKPLIEQSLKSIVQNGMREAPMYSLDLMELSISYRFPFSPDLYSLFIGHKEVVPVPRKLEWTPSAGFSGIVIYATGALPVHGETDKQTLTPCLFPRIYDEEMNLILSKEMIPRDVLEKGGPAAYSATADETPWQERIGLNPIRMMAEGIFGSNYTDIIISAGKAGKILYSEHNRELLSQGKILIICDLIQSD